MLGENYEDSLEDDSLVEGPLLLVPWELGASIVKSLRTFVELLFDTWIIRTLILDSQTMNLPILSTAPEVKSWPQLTMVHPHLMAGIFRLAFVLMQSLPAVVEDQSISWISGPI